MLGVVRTATRQDYDTCIRESQETFLRWRMLPAPQRGDYIRKIGNALRAAKSDLGLLVTLEAGKIRSEGEGEVQEMIDMCDFAVGLSRQLYGLPIATERHAHRMMDPRPPRVPLGHVARMANEGRLEHHPTVLKSAAIAKQVRAHHEGSLGGSP